jgi:hypothetical protein
VSDDTSLHSRRDALKCRAYGGAGTLFMLAGGVFAPVDLATAAEDKPGAARLGAVDTNEPFSFKFDKPGTYHFACVIHPRIVGTILVE